jgi:hypothetical protein
LPRRSPLAFNVGIEKFSDGEADLLRVIIEIGAQREAARFAA